MPGHATTLEGAQRVVSPVPALAATQEAVSQMTLNLKGEGMPAYAPILEGEEMVASSVATLETTPEVVSQVALNLTGNADSCNDAGRFGL
jgi:hypothetical protein